MAARERTMRASPRRWWSSGNLRRKGQPPRTRTRGVREARLEVEVSIGRHDQEADDPSRHKLRLVPRTLHARRGSVARSAGDLRPPVRKRPDLSRRVHGELVPADARRPSPISKQSTKKRRATCGTLPTRSLGRDRKLGRRHNASRDDARRYRGCDQSGGRALFRSARTRKFCCR